MHNDHTPSDVKSLTEFGSREHVSRIACRLEKNLLFRQRCDEWSRVPLADQRTIAARLLGKSLRAA